MTGTWRLDGRTMVHDLDNGDVDVLDLGALVRMQYGPQPGRVTFAFIPPIGEVVAFIADPPSGVSQITFDACKEIHAAWTQLDRGDLGTLHRVEALEAEVARLHRLGARAEDDLAELRGTRRDEPIEPPTP